VAACTKNAYKDHPDNKSDTPNPNNNNSNSSKNNSELTSTVVQSSDPNDKIGPVSSSGSK